MNKDLKETYNKIANDWHNDHLNDDWWKEVIELYSNMLPQNGTVLDVGCGTGVKSRFLSDKGKKVFAFDFSEEMINIAKKENPDIHFEVMDMKDIDSIEEKFDGVFVQAALLHIPKKEAPELVKKFSERLNDGGYLYIGVKQVSSDRPEEDIVKENDYGYDYERFFSYYTTEEIEKYMKDAGLEIVHSSCTKPAKTVWVQVIGRG